VCVCHEHALHQQKSFQSARNGCIRVDAVRQCHH
jgi:hypothetical protein